MPVTIVKRTLTSGRFQLSGDMRDDFAGVTVYSVSAASGRLHDDDPERVLIDARTLQTEGPFAKFLFSFQRLQQLLPGLHGLFSASGQYANKNLTAAEKFSIGGDNTVRAFPVGTLIGDQGYMATAELRWTPALFKIGQAQLAAVAFYDFGRITRNHNNVPAPVLINTTSISGHGIGLNLGYGQKFLFKVSAARQGKGIETVARSGARVWAQASYAF